MRRRGMKLAGAVASVTVGGLTLLPAAAFAASPNGQTYTETDHVHGQFYEPNATNPCNGDTFNEGQGALFTGELVDHVTAFTNSDEVWFTFTETGKVVGTDDGTGVTYTGQATAWGNFNMNQRNQNSAFTMSLHLTGSNGTTITGHETTVFVDNGNGNVTVEFGTMNLTCGQ